MIEDADSHADHQAGAFGLDTLDNLAREACSIFQAPAIFPRALEGAEFAAEQHRADAYHDAIYHAYWEEDRDIASLDVLAEARERSFGFAVTAF